MREFTPNQIDALNALEGEFGPVDPYLHNVTSDEHVKGEYGYVHWIERSLTDALRSWGQYKYALTVDWEEKARKEREEMAAARAARAEDVRERVMLGFMSGLIPVLNRAKNDNESVDFKASSRYIDLSLEDDEKSIIEMSYDVQMSTLYTSVEGAVFEDNCAVVSGNDRPAEQMEGFGAVLEWIKGRDLTPGS